MSQWIGRKLGTYRVLAQVRATTLDVVYRAFDEKLGRVVALQVWLPDVILPSELPSAMRAFTGMLTQLSHPNIGSLLDCDVYDGALCLTYDFVPTRALHRRFYQAQTWQQAAQILSPVAQALAYAHRMGVVHGTLRPEQIILREDGSPVIFDFGIELLVQQELSRAVPESTWLGSDLNSFLAPERALGQRLDASADLYSLGMIMVEWMTDHRAYSAETPLGEVLARYQDPNPRLRQRLMKPDRGTRSGRVARLDQVPLRILTRVLQPDPRRRLADSQHFALLLAKAALGQDIPAPLVENPRWQPFKMQRSHWAALAAILILGLLAGLGLYATAHPTQTTAWAAQAGLIELTPTGRPVAQGVAPTITPTQTLTPTPTVIPTFTRTPTPTITPVDPHSLPFLAQTPLPTVAQPITRKNAQRLVSLGRWGLGHSRAVAFSSDGSRLAMATTTGVYIYELPAFAPIGYLNTVDPVNALAYMPEDEMIITAEESGLVRLWNTTNFVEEFPFSGHALPVRILAVSTDGRWIASADEKTIFLWDVRDRSQVARLEGHFGTVNDLAFSPDGNILVSVSADFTVRLWDTSDGSAQASYSYTSGVYSVVFAPAGNKFYTTGADRSIQVWTVGDAKSTLFARSNTAFTRLIVAQDGQSLAASGNQGELAVWDSAGKLLWQAQDQNLPYSLGAISYPHAVAFQPGTGKLASMLWDNTIILHNQADGQVNGRLDRYGDFYTRTVISPDSRTLLAETIGGQVKVWDLPSAELRLTVPGRLLDGRVISADNTQFVVKSGPGEVSVYSLAGEKSFTFSKHVTLIGASFSPDGKLLLTGGPGQLRIWSLVSGLELQTTHNFGLGGCDTIYSLPEQGSKLIAFATRYNFLDFSGHNNDALCYMALPGWASLLTYDPDGVLAAAAVNSRVSVWNFKRYPHEIDAENTKGEANNLTGATSTDDLSKILQMAFNQDGSVLAAVFTDGSLRVWDATMSGSPLIQLSAHSAVPTALTISPDGRFLISTAQDGTLRVWGIIP